MIVRELINKLKRYNPKGKISLVVRFGEPYLEIDDGSQMTVYLRTDVYAIPGDDELAKKGGEI